jgi:Serine/Threonine/Tyrosine Kinase found in polyvalent proteins
MRLKYELQSIISGVGKDSKGSLIEAAAYQLGKSKEAGGDFKAIEFSKAQEAAQLINWINECNLWFTTLDESRFIARGYEQRVYLAEDVRFVVKLNDSVFYEYWLDYFRNLLIHNFLFPQTAYELLGFYLEQQTLYAVVKQPFIEITEPTDVNSVKDFLFSNGFQLKKNNDYFNAEVGIILEDLHDENVLTNNSALFFIDTAFYLMPSFFKDFEWK